MRDGEVKAPAAYLHGLTRNAADVADLAPCTASLGRRVLAVDGRERGRSAWDPDPFCYRAGPTPKTCSP
jgi:hypothetical protein